jgi:hypothetical protein
MRSSSKRAAGKGGRKSSKARPPARSNPALNTAQRMVEGFLIREIITCVFFHPGFFLETGVLMRIEKPGFAEKAGLEVIHTTRFLLFETGFFSMLQKK